MINYIKQNWWLILLIGGFILNYNFWWKSIKENYELLIGLAIFFVCTGFFLYLVGNLVTRILNRHGNEKRIQYRFVKSIFCGLAIPAIGMYAWFDSNVNPYNEYKLISNPSLINGQINKVEEYSEEVESNDSRQVDVVNYYYYEYTFELPGGKIISGSGNEVGNMPEYLKNIKNSPYPVVIEYVKDNPNINRVKGMKSHNRTIYEFLRYKILIGMIILIICSYMAYLVIKGGLKEYRTEIQKLKQNHFV